MTTDKVAGIGSDAVRKATGKNWLEWFALLDKAGAKKKSHPEIARALSAHNGISPWWQQMVTVAYEQARGLREKHQLPDGYQISRSKTFAAAARVLFAHFAQKRRRGQWLRDPDLAVRTASTNKCLRATWIDGKTSVEVSFAVKGPAKTQVTIQHRKLATAADAERMKKYWRDQLDRLSRLLQGTK